MTNQNEIVNHAKHCYENYPTIVNNIPKEKKLYKNTMLDYANVDNNLSKSRLAIGESSNLAQLALTYSYNFPDKKYSDYVCILSILAQVAIDNAKRKFDIDINTEIRRIKKDMDICKNGYPIFWSYIKNNFNNDKINKSLKCPMNYLVDLKFKEFNNNLSTLPMDYFFINHTLKQNRRISKKVENFIQKYSLFLYKHKDIDYDDYNILNHNFDKMIEDIKQIYISKDYIGLMSWLINRTFIITPNLKSNLKYLSSNTKKNKPILLKTLYTINAENLLKCFKKAYTEKK